MYGVVLAGRYSAQNTFQPTRHSQPPLPIYQTAPSASNVTSICGRKYSPEMLPTKVPARIKGLEKRGAAANSEFCTDFVFATPAHTV